MGLCASAPASEAVPRCLECEKRGCAPWHEMGKAERKQWVWKGGFVLCKACDDVAEIVLERFERDRWAYYRMKQRMYPRPSEGFRPLRRVRSGRKWEGTSSFNAGWRPSSSLEELVEVIHWRQQKQPHRHRGVQRKPTGFVPGHVPGADASWPEDELQEEGSAFQQHHSRQQRRRQHRAPGWAAVFDLQAAISSAAALMGRKSASSPAICSPAGDAAAAAAAAAADAANWEDGSVGLDSRESAAATGGGSAEGPSTPPPPEEFARLSDAELAAGLASLDEIESVLWVEEVALSRQPSVHSIASLAQQQQNSGCAGAALLPAAPLPQPPALRPAAAPPAASELACKDADASQAGAEPAEAAHASGSGAGMSRLSASSTTSTAGSGSADTVETEEEQAEEDGAPAAEEEEMCRLQALCQRASELSLRGDSAYASSLAWTPVTP